MSKTLVVFATVSGLMMSTALAQAPSAPSPAPAATSAVSNSAEVVTAQSTDELLASRLKGTAVTGSDDQKIGEVTDILFDKMGHVKAYIVSIGGFLGIGAKEVALEWSAFDEMPTIKGRPEDKHFTVYQLKVSMTKDQLKQMAEFKPLTNTPVTTGEALGNSRPAGTDHPDGAPVDIR
jgi:sporulation protein YlmC with PRC-barrel domain